MISQPGARRAKSTCWHGAAPPPPFPKRPPPVMRSAPMYPSARAVLLYGVALGTTQGSAGRILGGVQVLSSPGGCRCHVVLEGKGFPAPEWALGAAGDVGRGQPGGFAVSLPCAAQHCRWGVGIMWDLWRFSLLCCIPNASQTMGGTEMGGLGKTPGFSC